jgi:hypothetical protein
VEVAVKEESPPKWVAAQVVVMLIDGMFQAQIVLPDGTDEWLDWFTWEEEGSDWRRAENKTVVTGAVTGAVPSSKAAGKARVPPAGDQPPAKKAKSKRIVVDDEDSEDNDLFD